MLMVLFQGALLEAKVVEYELTIALKNVRLSEKPVTAMAINGGIPGPVLRFKEGDIARIHVVNQLKTETSIHWHGVLVPPDMDGVPYISFPPIKPGGRFTYEFPIRQSGTYWYHSHSNLQEQSGVYGAIVIEPSRSQRQIDRDHVVLFSDWTDENPHEVLRTLKRGSDWYALEKGSSQSILGAARKGRLGDYFRRELQRMPAMDIADVAYDRFLANGKSQIALHAEAGESVRLRIIDGSATTYFYLEFAGGPMEIIAADGQDVMPLLQQRFLIGVAETYDVLVKVPASGAYELRATAHDGSGHASVWIGSGRRQAAPDVPRPDLYHPLHDFAPNQIFALTPAAVMGMSDHRVQSGQLDQPGMADMNHSHVMPAAGQKPPAMSPGMDHPEHNHGAGPKSHPTGMPKNHAAEAVKSKAPGDHTGDMPHPPGGGRTFAKDFRPMAADVSSAKFLAADGVDPARPWPPYAGLRAVSPTAPAKAKPVRQIRLTLDGDMERYAWFLNNKPLSETDVIRIRAGETVRFVMINRTMMHHPMHLHGHFFRVVNGQGDHAPLKHTVDVAPMSTTVIEFDANEVGDWFFHCHLLYHMKSGMARLIHYEDFSLDPVLASIRPKLYGDAWYFWAQADVLSNMTDGYVSASNTRNILKAEWEAGWQQVDDTEWEAVLTWDRYVNRFFSYFAGANLLGAGGAVDDTRGVLGLHYLLPLNIESRGWLDTDGGARVLLEKSFEFTPRLALKGELEYDTHDSWEGSVDLHYLVSKSISAVVRWHSDFSWGVGIQIRF